MRRRDSDPIPTLARMVIAALAGPHYQEHILGDLEEEYQFIDNGKGRRAWIWKQVIATIPGLLALRSREWNLRAIGLTLIVTLFAYAFLFVWGLYVLRPIMIGMRESFVDTAPWEYLSFYLLIRMPGVVIVSAAIAYFTFETRGNYARNFSQRLLPLVMILVLPQLWYGLTASDAAVTSDLLLRVLSDGVIVAIGGSLGWWLKLKQMRN